jgi:transposase
VPLRDRPATGSLNRGVDAPNAYLRSVASSLSRIPKEQLVFVGVDTHKDTLAACCVDAAGRALDQQTFPNDPYGHQDFLAWTRRVCAAVPARIGIEGSANFGAGVSRLLREHDVDVREVPAKLTGRERTRLRRPGKTDPTDALAIARVTARDTDLPPARRQGQHEDLKVLVDAREELVVTRTAEANRLHADLAILLPGYGRRLPNLIGEGSLHIAEDLLQGLHGVRAGVARRRLLRLTRLDEEIAELASEIKDAVAATGTSLTKLHGVGPIVAARILGEVGDIRRFPTRDHFAAGNGTAPIPVVSGRTDRHRLNRGGNRRINRALHVIARTQATWHPEAKAYVERKRTAGKTRQEAIRCLKRRLSDVVYKTMLDDQRGPTTRPA